MLHRHVIAVATKIGAPDYRRAVLRLRRRLAGWTQVVDSDLASAWVFRAPPSKLKHRRLGAAGCLIGLDFNTELQDTASLIARSWGAYIAVAVDEVQRSVEVLRDPTGRIECWRLSLEGLDVFFSHYEDVYWLASRPVPLNWEYITHQLSQDCLHGETTGLQGVTEILPGQALIYLDGNSTSHIRWWPHEIAAAPHADVDAAMMQLRAAAQTAVAAWADQYDRIGLFLSGGLDSSIVLGLLRQSGADRQIVGLNHQFPGEQGDERIFARMAAKMHGVHLVLEREPVISNIDFKHQLPRRFMRPRSAAIVAGFDEEDATFAREHHLEAFFTGTGGDHLFYQSVPISAATDYLHTGGGVGGYIGTSLDLARLSGETVWSVFATTLRHRLLRRHASTNLYDRHNSFLSERARRAANFGRFLHPWIEEAAEHSPPGKLAQIMNIVELQRHYARVGHADVADEIHPLFSQPLLEASLATPAYWFGLHGMQRGLARRAFADLLPPAIRNRRSKGRSTTYALDFLAKCVPKVRELLLEGHLSRRGLLDLAVVDRATTPLGIAETKDLTALFICLGTELWIQQAESDRASAEATTAEPVMI